ncbi:DUF2585 family protein [Sphingomonas sp. GCM10030256]|uniref:DUF2585 family protein n=1 Tax=Sphingomonas sp. GCM10030256 TaxID=3273427 RepID=UPI003623346F
MIRSAARPLWGAVLIVAATAAILWLMGRPALCTCGDIDLWVGSASSPKTSQMLADWYSLSHLIHGLLFYAALHLLMPGAPVQRRLAVATLIEAAWELLENSPVIIDRYREATIALGYTGDSILNSVSDIAMMAAGFGLARRLPVWASAALAIGLELLALSVIRDNLTLNVWMLLAPSETVRAWQAG